MMTSLDRPLLYAAGWVHGLSDSILWGKDNEGNNWQAVEEAGYFLFAKQLPMGNTESLRRMGTTKWYSIFGGTK